MQRVGEEGVTVPRSGVLATTITGVAFKGNKRTLASKPCVERHRVAVVGRDATTLADVDADAHIEAD